MNENGSGSGSAKTAKSLDYRKGAKEFKLVKTAARKTGLQPVFSAKRPKGNSIALVVKE